MHFVDLICPSSISHDILQVVEMCVHVCDHVCAWPTHINMHTERTTLLPKCKFPFVNFVFACFHRRHCELTSWNITVMLWPNIHGKIYMAKYSANEFPVIHVVACMLLGQSIWILTEQDEFIYRFIYLFYLKLYNLMERCEKCWQGDKWSKWSCMLKDNH